MNEEKCCYASSRDYEDCRYYSVTFDMGANIAHCTLNPPDGMEALSYCPCIDNKGKCKQYISKKDSNGDFIAGQQRMADRVLEIVDKWKYDETWCVREDIWNERMDAIKGEIEALKEVMLNDKRRIGT